MGKSLSEIVNSALSDADRNLKIASAYDATTVDSGDFLAAELAEPRAKTAASEEDSFSKKEREGAKKIMKEHERSMHHEHGEHEKKESALRIRDDAAYGLKLATALEQSAYLVAKLAADTDPSTHPSPVTVGTGGAGTSPLSAPGPDVMSSGFIGEQTAHPRAQSTVSGRIPGPSLSNSDLPTSKADHTGKLDGQMPPNNTGKTAGWTRSKEASERVLRAKVAQAELLSRLGQTKAAEALMQEVYKQAQDPSSPPPELPAHNESFRMSTEPGESSMIPDNAGLIAMSRAQAKDRSVRTTSEYLSETPRQDNAVAAHTLRTDGLKVSSLDAVGEALGLPFGGSEKTAKSWEEKLEKLKAKAESKGLSEKQKAKAEFKSEKYQQAYKKHQAKNEMTESAARDILNARPSGAKYFWGGPAYADWDRGRREAARAFLEQKAREKTSALTTIDAERLKEAGVADAAKHLAGKAGRGLLTATDRALAGTGQAVQRAGLAVRSAGEGAASAGRRVADAIEQGGRKIEYLDPRRSAKSVTWAAEDLKDRILSSKTLAELRK